MAEIIKFSPEEVESVLKKLTNEEQFKRYQQDKELIMNLCNGYQSPLLEFTSKAKADLVQLIIDRKERQQPVDVNALMEGRKVPEGRTEEDERGRIERVISALDAGEDPTKYKAKMRVKLSDSDLAGRQAITPDMSFPRRELVVASEIKLGDVAIKLNDDQIGELKTKGRLNEVVEGVDSNGEVHKFFVAKDQDLNTLRFLDQKKVVLPKYVYGVELKDGPQTEMKDGKIAEFEIKAKGEVKTVQGYFDPVTYKIKFLQDTKDQVLRTAETQAQINQMNQETTLQKTTQKGKTKSSQMLTDMISENNKNKAHKPKDKAQKHNQGQSM